MLGLSDSGNNDYALGSIYSVPIYAGGSEARVVLRRVNCMLGKLQSRLLIANTHSLPDELIFIQFTQHK
jgi:hypothetical protein